MTLSEKSLSRLLDTHEKVPPFRVLYNFDKLCMDIGHEDPKTVEAFSSIISVITKLLPAEYTITESQLGDEVNAGLVAHPMTVPLHEVIDVGRVIVEIHWQYYHELGEEHYELKKQLLDNENSYHGLTPYSRRKNFVPPATQVDEEPATLINIYLKNTPFQEFLFYTQVQFKIGRDRWPTHAVILAPSEWGKSELTGTFFKEAIEDTNERAVILCDPHGDLYNKALSRVPPERLVAIDLATNPPDLNILDRSVMSDRSALDTFRFLMSSLADGLTPKQEACIRPLFALLSTIEDANLITLHEIITEQAKKPKQFAEQISRLNPVHRAFFENLWYSGNFSDTREALMWKVGAAIDDPTFNKMFSAKRCAIDVSRWIEERKIVLIKSGDRLDKQGTQLFFLFIVGQYYAAAKRRDALPQHKRHLAMMFVDEASIVMSSPIISDILVEIRKYNCAFIAATQLWQHIAQEVRPAVLGSTGIRILGQLGHDEASALYRDMKVPLETITGLQNVPGQYAQWCLFVRSVTQQGVVVKTPYGALEAMPVIDPHGEANSDEDDFEELLEGFPQEEETDSLPQRPEDGFRENERDYAKEEQEDFDACYERAMKELTVEAEASEATIKPGRDWSEPT